MHDVVAFSESQDLAAAEGNVAGVPDDHITVNGDDIVVGPNNMIIGALACVGTNGTRARIVSPSLRRVNTLDIRPLTLALFAGDIAGFRMFPTSPIALETYESMQCLFTADPAAAEQETCVLFTAPGAIAPISGKIYPVRFSWTRALLAGQWANSGINLIDDLPNGNYTVVGASLVAATGIAFRFVPVGAASRPGGIVQQTVDNMQHPAFRFGGLGAWFDFNTVMLPSMDVIASAAAGAATYFGTMDVMAK